MLSILRQHGTAALFAAQAHTKKKAINSRFTHEPVTLAHAKPWSDLAQVVVKLPCGTRPGPHNAVHVAPGKHVVKSPLHGPHASIATLKDHAFAVGTLGKLLNKHASSGRTRHFNHE